MTSSRFRSFAFAYGTAFAVLYAVALKLDLALFTVYPSLGVVLLGTHHSRDITAPSMAFLAPAMYLVRLDRHGRARSARVRARCGDLARAMDAARLAGLAVGGSRVRDDRVRLPHIAMVSTLATGRVRSLTGARTSGSRTSPLRRDRARSQAKACSQPNLRRYISPAKHESPPDAPTPPLSAATRPAEARKRHHRGVPLNPSPARDPRPMAVHTFAVEVESASGRSRISSLS